MALSALLSLQEASAQDYNIPYILSLFYLDLNLYRTVFVQYIFTLAGIHKN